METADRLLVADSTSTHDIVANGVDINYGCPSIGCCNDNCTDFQCLGNLQIRNPEIVPILPKTLVVLIPKIIHYN